MLKCRLLTNPVVLTGLAEMEEEDRQFRGLLLGVQSSVVLCSSCYYYNRHFGKNQPSYVAELALCSNTSTERNLTPCPTG